MSNPWPPSEPTDSELWDELGNADDPRRQEIFFLLGVRTLDKEKSDEAIALFEQSLELSEKLGYTREKYFSLMWIARCHTDAKNWEKVSEVFALIEESAVPELEPQDLAQMFRTKAFAMRERRRALDAIEAFQIAENYSRDNGDHFYMCMDAIQRAKIHALLREFTVAKEILTANLEFAREHGITSIAAATQYTLGKVYLEAGEIGAAVATLQDAVTCLEAMDDHHYLNDAKLALGTAYVRAGDFAAADAIFTPLEEGLRSWDAELRASIVLTRAEMTLDPAEVATLHKKARALAINEGAYHFVNVVDINIAVVMAEMGDLAGAEKVLRDVIASAERFDDQDIINEARVRLASVLVETHRADEALSLLETMSIATFGDDTFGWQRYALVRSTAAMLVGEIDEAEETVRVIMNLDRTWANLPLIAEAYWVTSQIEEHRNGKSATWEHMLSASVAMTLQVGNTELATERSRDLVPATPETSGAYSSPTIPRQPITSPDGLLRDISEANGE